MSDQLRFPPILIDWNICDESLDPNASNFSGGRFAADQL